MNPSYARDLDLNLLRVFVVVAESGSVTGAAGRLYLTQPAVSAALRRLNDTVGAPLFVRDGRGLALTSRGQKLFAAAQPHLEALVEHALSPATFDPRTTDRMIRIGLSDSSETWLLPRLLRALAVEAPNLKLIVLPVQFRTVSAALTTRAVDLAVTVADELPAGVRRAEMFTGGFACLFDPRHARVGKRLTREKYLEHEHVIVSYNGDLLGIIEEQLGVQRKIRVSVPSFHAIGPIVDGTALLATVPRVVGNEIVAVRKHLEMLALPLELKGTPLELLWPSAADDDDAITFLRELIVRTAKAKRA